MLSYIFRGKMLMLKTPNTILTSK